MKEKLTEQRRFIDGHKTLYKIKLSASGNIGVFCGLNCVSLKDMSKSLPSIPTTVILSENRPNLTIVLF